MPYLRTRTLRSGVVGWGLEGSINPEKGGEETEGVILGGGKGKRLSAQYCEKGKSGLGGVYCYERKEGETRDAWKGS